MTQTPEQFAGGMLPDAGSSGGVSVVRVKNQFLAEHLGFPSHSLVFAVLSDWLGVLFGLILGVSVTANCGGQL